MTRRGVLAVGWTAPVIAAAVAAPGAAASALSGTGLATPAVTKAREAPTIGLFLSEVGGGRFLLEVRVAARGPAGAPVVVPADGRINIDSQHDVQQWGGGIIADDLRSAHMAVPAGSYPSTATYTSPEGDVYQVANVGRAVVSLFAWSPQGTFAVTATVTEGPIYVGADPNALAVFGWAMRVVAVSV